MSIEESRIFLWCNGLHYYPVVDAETRCYSDGSHNKFQAEAVAWCDRTKPLTYEGLLVAGAPEEVLLNLLLVDGDQATVMKCSGYPSKAPKLLFHLVNERNTRVLAHFPTGRLAEALKSAPDMAAVPYVRSIRDPDMWLLLDQVRHEETNFEGVAYHGFVREEFLRAAQGEATPLEKRLLWVSASKPPIAMSDRTSRRWEAEHGDEARLLRECPNVPAHHLCPP